MKEERLEELETTAQVLKGLINYHKRMTMPLDVSKCKDECPVLKAENDIYLMALETALFLTEREILEGFD